MVDYVGTDCNKVHISGGMIDATKREVVSTPVETYTGHALVFQHDSAHPDGPAHRARMIAAAQKLNTPAKPATVPAPISQRQSQP